MIAVVGEFRSASWVVVCLLNLVCEAAAQTEQSVNDPAQRAPQTDRFFLIDDAELRNKKPAASEPTAEEQLVPNTLASAMSRALHANPDILVAIARLDEIRAQRDQIRLKVVEEVSQAIHEIEANQDESYSLRRRRSDKTAPEQGKSEGTLQAELAAIQSHLGYLLGVGNDSPEGKSNPGRTYAEALAGQLAGDTAAALARALRSNPDLRLAEAKVRGAEAALNQTKLATAHKVTVAFHRRQNDQQTLEARQAAFDSGNISTDEILAARQAAAESESELLYLLGVGANAPANEPWVEIPSEPATNPNAPHSPSKRPELPKQLQAALAKKVTWMHKPATMGNLLELLSSQADVRIVATNAAAIVPVKIEAVQDVSLLTLLEMVADQSGCAFIVRDYGLLVVLRADAWQYPGAAIPSDLPSVQAASGEDH